MASGALDINGIWQYGESDLEATFSELLNLGQEATSLAVGALKTRATSLELSRDNPTVFVAASSAARDTHWGAPANAAQRRALQDKGAITVRLDTGRIERYFAGTTDGGANPMGRAAAGWAAIGGGLYDITPSAVVGGTIGASGRVTFAAVSTVSLDGIFNDDFDNNIIYYTLTAHTAAADLFGRLRTAGADLVAATSYGSLRAWLLSSGQTVAAADSTEWTLDASGSLAAGTALGAGEIHLQNANVNTRTSGWHDSTMGSTSAALIGTRTHLVHDVNAVADGFTLRVPSGTISGHIRVVGYNNP